MNLRPKFIAHMLIFSILIALLVQPSLLIAIQNLTPKEAYPNGSLVITYPAQADYPQDLRYCYEGQNTITVCVVFYNTPTGNPSWMSPTIEQYSRASITIQITGYHWINESTTSYYDIEYENKLTQYRNSDNAMLVVSFTSLVPQPSDTYGHLAGYSRVQAHISIAFMSSLRDPVWAQYIIVHEMAHTLGYFPEPNGHSSNSGSIMYSVYSGSNNQFDTNDITLLRDLHS